MTGKTAMALPNDLLAIKHFQLASAESVGSGVAKSFKSVDVGISNPTGYVPVGITKISTANTQISLSYFATNPSGYYCFAVRNGSSSSANARPILDIVYAKSDYVENGTDTTGKLFKVLKFTHEYASLAKNTNLQISATDLGFYVPAGYQIFSIAGAGSGSSAVSTISIDPFEEDCILQIRNASSSAISSTASIEVSFIRKDYAEAITASA